MFFRGARSKFVARRDLAEMEIAPGQQRMHLLPVAVERVKRDAEYGRHILECSLAVVWATTALFRVVLIV